MVGIGGTRRILVSDTLLAAYSDDEIEVILAHELAHHVHGDLWKAIGVDAVLTLGALAFAHLVLQLVPPMSGVTGPADVAGLPVLLLASILWSLVTLPVVNGVSRAHERQADRFALDLTGNPEAFISAMRRLGAQNLAEEQPSRLSEWLFHSHPPLSQRLAAARAWQASAPLPGSIA
jgi:STE24 endopeptidase